MPAQLLRLLGFNGTVHNIALRVRARVFWWSAIFLIFLLGVYYPLAMHGWRVLCIILYFAVALVLAYVWSNPVALAIAGAIDYVATNAHELRDVISDIARRGQPQPEKEESGEIELKKTLDAYMNIFKQILVWCLITMTLLLVFGRQLQRFPWAFPIFVVLCITLAVIWWAFGYGGNFGKRTAYTAIYMTSVYVILLIVPWVNIIGFDLVPYITFDGNSVLVQMIGDAKRKYQEDIDKKHLNRILAEIKWHGTTSPENQNWLKEYQAKMSERSLLASVKKAFSTVTASASAAPTPAPEATPTPAPTASPVGPVGITPVRNSAGRLEVAFNPSTWTEEWKAWLWIDLPAGSYNDPAAFGRHLLKSTSGLIEYPAAGRSDWGPRGNPGKEYQPVKTETRGQVVMKVSWEDEPRDFGPFTTAGGIWVAVNHPMIPTPYIPDPSLNFTSITDSSLQLIF